MNGAARGSVGTVPKARWMRALVLGVVVSLAYGQAANAQPSSKVTAKVGDIQFVGPEDVWTTILSNTLKTGNQKDLFIDVSLESMLMTRTKAKSKGGQQDTAVAEAGIAVRVLIDGVPALPGVVVFAKREQTLSATFQGLLEGCLDAEGHLNLDAGTCTDGSACSVAAQDCADGSECITCLGDESVELILRTMSANAFNFIQDDLSSGDHLIEVQAKINTATDGDADASALVGKGSVTVQEVRLIQNEDIEL